MEPINPKDIPIKTLAGDEKTYRISRFPAVAGREIVAKYPLSGLPKLGDYAVNEETMLKLMSYVFVEAGGDHLPLNTKALVNNHVPDLEALARIEFAMLSYNTSFFQSGKASTFLSIFKAQLKEWSSSTLMDSLEKLLQAAKQPSKNLKQSTR